MSSMEQFRSPQTIFALSSGPGPAGVAVIRISGPLAGSALIALSGRLPPARLARLATLRDASGDVLDEALVLHFPAGASFTGEETAELQVHGGRAVVRAVLDALAAMPGLRFAERGEFARRAFENGRLDLPQVESLAALVAAETEQQRRQALRGVSGALGRAVAQWRGLLLEARALVAATIDFSDEGDTDGVEQAIRDPLVQLRQALATALASAERGRIVADGFRIAIVGRPNTGKSTLLNRLAGSEVAIVTEHAGTTRDVIEVRLDIGGYAVVLQDTAGLRDTSDPVERIGIERTHETAARADMVLWLDETGSFDGVHPAPDVPTIRIRTKSDVAGDAAPVDALAISARSGDGIDSLLKRISNQLEQLGPPEDPLIVQDRQRKAVVSALQSVEAALAEPLERIEFIGSMCPMRNVRWMNSSAVLASRKFWGLFSAASASANRRNVSRETGARRAPLARPWFHRRSAYAIGQAPRTTSGS